MAKQRCSFSIRALELYIPKPTLRRVLQSQGAIFGINLQRGIKTEGHMALGYGCVSVAFTEKVAERVPDE